MSAPAKQGGADLAKATERRWSYPAAFLSAGGIAAALGAASCCVVPFLLFLAGISGAWIGNLTALAHYQPIFTAVAVGCIGYGAYLVYWKPHAACAEGSHCIRPASDGLARIGLWGAGVLVIVAISFPYLARVLFGA
jgi:mercuric ion transport protein